MWVIVESMILALRSVIAPVSARFIRSVRATIMRLYSSLSNG